MLSREIIDLLAMEPAKGFLYQTRDTLFLRLGCLRLLTSHGLRLLLLYITVIMTLPVDALTVLRRPLIVIGALVLLPFGSR